MKTFPFLFNLSMNSHLCFGKAADEMSGVFSVVNKEVCVIEVLSLNNEEKAIVRILLRSDHSTQNP